MWDDEDEWGEKEQEEGEAEGRGSSEGEEGGGGGRGGRLRRWRPVTGASRWRPSADVIAAVAARRSVTLQLILFVSYYLSSGKFVKLGL